jgi:hypothetical protein
MYSLQINIIIGLLRKKQIFVPLYPSKNINICWYVNTTFAHYLIQNIIKIINLYLKYI